MTVVRRLIASKPIFWTILALPAAVVLPRAFSTDVYLPDDIIAPTGLWSARFLIVALMLTPLFLLLKAGWVRWLVGRRRAIGVAAFVYASLHLGFYLVDMGAIDAILAELGAFGIWTGWAAILLMLPLAATSNDAAMRALRSGWKRLQRLAYPAALLTLLHWAFIHDDLIEALVHFAPLVALQLYRIVHRLPFNTRSAAA